MQGGSVLAFVSIFGCIGLGCELFKHVSYVVAVLRGQASLIDAMLRCRVSHQANANPVTMIMRPGSLEVYQKSKKSVMFARLETLRTQNHPVIFILLRSMFGVHLPYTTDRVDQRLASRIAVYSPVYSTYDFLKGFL